MKSGNRPFYWYGSHIELIGFKEYYGMPRGHQQDPVYSRQYVCGLFGPIFLKVFLEKDCNGKKDQCAVFGCNNDRLFPEKYTVRWCSFFAQKARVSTERVPPGHPIILLKSNKFNMVTVSVERSIYVVVMQWWRRNVQKSMLHVQSCCFANVNLLLFWCSCCCRCETP